MNRAHNRAGFSLIEGLIAITLLAVVVTALAPAMFYAAQLGNSAAEDGQGNATMLERTNMLSAVPFADVADYAGCDTIASGPYPHVACVEVSSVSSDESLVRVVVTPTAGFGTADTVEITRVRPLTTNPFCQSC